MKSQVIDMNGKDKNGKTPFMNANITRYTDVVKKFFTQCASALINGSQTGPQC